jgi:hypothetical protein
MSPTRKSPVAEVAADVSRQPRTRPLARSFCGCGPGCSGRDPHPAQSQYIGATKLFTARRKASANKAGNRASAEWNSVPGARRRVLMPPCGSPLRRTTKSVPLPVSALNASSEMIREDRGDAIPAIRSNVSCAMTMRSSAVIALPGSVSIGSNPPTNGRAPGHLGSKARRT